MLILLWVKAPTCLFVQISAGSRSCLSMCLCRKPRCTGRTKRWSPGPLALAVKNHTFSFNCFFSAVLNFKSWQKDSHSFVRGCYNVVTKERVLVGGCQLFLITTPQLISGPATSLSLLLCLAHIKKMNYSPVALPKSILYNTFQHREQRMG